MRTILMLFAFALSALALFVFVISFVPMGMWNTMFALFFEPRIEASVDKLLEAGIASPEDSDAVRTVFRTIYLSDLSTFVIPLGLSMLALSIALFVFGYTLRQSIRISELDGSRR